MYSCIVFLKTSIQLYIINFFFFLLSMSTNFYDCPQIVSFRTLLGALKNLSLIICLFAFISVWFYVCVYSLYPLVGMLINEKLKKLREFLMCNLILASNFIYIRFIYCIHESFCGLTLWCVDVIEVGVDKKQPIYVIFVLFWFL